MNSHPTPWDSSAPGNYFKIRFCYPNVREKRVKAKQAMLGSELDL